MPRFTDTERETIQQTLMEEGQRIFAVHGLKRVTIKDLASAVNISAGSFYAFYESKEHLFVTINFHLQNQLFEELKEYLEANRHLPPAELAAKAFRRFYKRAMEYPILPGIDAETMNHLRRKLPPEVFEQHTQNDDAAIVEILGNYGIKFKKSNVLIAKAMQTLYGCATALDKDEDFDEVIDILIAGIIAQMQ